MDRMLYAFVEATVGAVARVQPIPRGTTARVWCVDGAHGRVAVKQHGRGRGFAQECTALTTLGGDEHALWPRLLAHDSTLRALVTTWLSGTAADAPAIASSCRAALFQSAGELRRHFDGIPAHDDDPLPLADALAQRMASLLADASLDAALAARVRAAWRPEVFAHATRRFCHRDFAPHNWLVVPGEVPRLHCLDFGHARADHPLVDLARALSPAWGVPDARAALLAGYGRAFTPDDLEQLQGLELLDAVATSAWARRRGDARLAAAGAAAIERSLGR